MNSSSSCVPCATMDPSFLLSEQKIRDTLATTLPLWKLVVTTTSQQQQQQENDDGASVGNLMSISRTFTAKNFSCALDCINQMGVIAERESHHPDFHLTNYREVEIVLLTHKLQGVTESDLQLAAMLDAQVKIRYSPKWLKGHPEAASTAAAAAAEEDD